jgi:hypothetical protein
MPYALTIFLCLALMACAYLLAEVRNLKRFSARQDEQIAYVQRLLDDLEEQLKDWQNKALARNSMTPLGEEREEATSGGAAKSQAFDLRPPIARAHEDWDEEEREEWEREHPLPLPSDVRTDLLDAAREVS